jgi:hypothetical protein
MSWTEIDTVNGTSYNYDRTKKLALSEVQSGLVQCQLDEVTWNDIPDSTVISFQIIPGASNATGIYTPAFSWMKGASQCTTGAGSFCDNTLTPFRNIMRYTCHSKNPNARAYEILSQYSPATPGGSSSTNTNTSSYNVILGSRYTVNGFTGATAGNTAPVTTMMTPRNGYTAQSYYRNFFIRSDLLGDINSTNDTYDCPKVMEPVTYSAGQAIPANTQTYWPLDTNFSLAITNTSVWSVGVPAATSISKTGSTSGLCVGEVTDGSDRITDSRAVVQCLGYAKKPNTDGTCGTIQDSTGLTRPLTRLRRYRVVYPPMFDASGKVLATNAFADEVYIADRLVVDNTGTATGAMVYGPKPCNYSWFDHEGVTTRDGTVNFHSDLKGDDSTHYATPGYVATSDYQYMTNHSAYSTAPTPAATPLNQWPVDPDGLILPNQDNWGSVTNAQNYSSCSATLPWIDLVNGNPNDLRLITTNAYRTDSVMLGSRKISLSEVSQTTVDPWYPNYVEDISFQGCVPLPTTYIDPPLHFYRQDSNTMGWCAEVYPTQNPYWYALNAYRKPQSGSNAVAGNVANYPTSVPGGTAAVKIYTSHDLNAADTSSSYLDSYNGNCTGESIATICSATDPGDANCSAFLARTSTAVCDRTVVFDSSKAFTGFPLLAKDYDINKMLTTDLANNKTFGCQYSVNVDSTKVGVKTPSSGCCGYVGTPSVAILQNIPIGKGGHLEPYYDPSATTATRFCGWPVQ